MTDCRCYRCVSADAEANPLPASEKLFGVVDPRTAIMFVCQKCGNKRCPHTADHRNSCTRSNAPGQKGSLYEIVLQPKDPTHG